MDKNDFISLWDAIEAIASKVPLPDQWRIEAGGLPGWDVIEERIREKWANRKDRKRSLTEGLTTRKQFPRFRAYLYQHSDAADQLLAKSPDAVEKPVWVQVAQGMGRLRPSDQAAADGVQYLHNWAQTYPAWVDECRLGRWRVDREVPYIRVPRLMYLKYDNAGRATSIGFGRTDLVNYLNKAGIPHALTLPDSSPTGLETEVAPDQLSGVGRNGVDKGGDGGQRASNVAENCTRPKRKFRGYLAETLEKAHKNADNPEDYASVFVALRTLALKTPPEPPLLGIKSQNCVLYKSESGDERSFTKQDMRDRIRSKSSLVRPTGENHV